MKHRNTHKELLSCILLSTLGMLGSSGTVLADTFFIASRLGASGLTALNLAIPVFGLLNGIGLLLGVGGATRFSLLQATGQEEEGNRIFTIALLTTCGVGIFLSALGLTAAPFLSRLLGAEGSILPLCSSYLKTILCFAPFFSCNHLLLAFVRNDGAPRLAMAGMLTGSLANILLDYLFLYPLDMGMFGAALATCLAPLISLTVLCLHFIRKKNHFHVSSFRFQLCHLADLADLAGLGSAAFLNELSSTVVLTVFNFLILYHAGDTGVAAYGIVANLALVASAILTGISHGVQPLFSRAYGSRDLASVRTADRLAKGIALAFGGIVLLAVNCFPAAITAAFNQAGDPALAEMAESGLQLYFAGFLFAGCNLLSCARFAATEQPRQAFWLSFTRGCTGIVLAAVFFSSFLGLTGIWIAFPVTELAVFAFTMRGKSVRYADS